MRYVLIGLAMVVVAVIATAVAVDEKRSEPGATARATAVQSTASPVRRLAPTVLPLELWRWTTPIPTLRAHVTRERAIAQAMGMARGWKEPNPELIDAEQMTFREALVHINPPGEPLEGESSAPASKSVWLMRVRGSFLPDRVEMVAESEGVTPRRVPGWMFMIIDVETGQAIGKGTRPESFPVR